MNTPPEILADDVRQAPGTLDHVLVTVTCPHCGKRHTHGAEKGQTVGYRASHCRSNGGYIINA